jgi:hypothetical protein
MAEIQLPRLIILGAGFSRPAGLPLSTELLDLVLAELRRFEGQETHLHRSLAAYLDYKEATSQMRPDPVDVEDFAAYLYHRHAFGLLGFLQLNYLPRRISPTRERCKPTASPISASDDPAFCAWAKVLRLASRAAFTFRS